MRKKILEGGKENDDKETYSGQGEVVEDLCAIFPGVGVAVLLLALIVEAVHLGDLPALVVTPEERDLVGPPVKEPYMLASGGRKTTM